MHAKAGRACGRNTSTPDGNRQREPVGTFRAAEEPCAEGTLCVSQGHVSVHQRKQDSSYDVKWNAWLKKHSHELILRVGECLNGEGFSSDPLVVSDSLAAMASGQATVLVGEDVYFITVTDK